MNLHLESSCTPFEWTPIHGETPKVLMARPLGSGMVESFVTGLIELPGPELVDGMEKLNQWGPGTDVRTDMRDPQVRVPGTRVRA